MANIHERLQNIPYSNQSYATRPSKLTMFWRRCFIYQIFKFWELNIKIMILVASGHS